MRDPRRPRLLACLAGVALLGCGGTPSKPPSKPPPTTGGGHFRVLYGAPAGQFTGHGPRAVLLLLHGGGWRGHDPRAVAGEVTSARPLRRLGYETAVVDYGPGPQGVDDVVRAYDLARRRFGAATPICAVGDSAGGHLALMLAARRRGLTCAISLAGPTDLPGLGRTPGYAVGYDLARQAFGHELERFSPLRHAHTMRAALMLVYAANDPYVPPSQGTALARARPGTRLLVLPPGSVPFVHSRVDAAAARRAEALEMQFLGQATAPKR